MRIDEIRRLAKAVERLNIFIALSSETGDGEIVAVKDIVDVRGMPTTAGGAILPREPAAQDAPLIRNMRRKGCVVIGKTNMHEWAFGATSINRIYGPVRNPRDPDRIAGGSSGGSAAAVAAGLCDWAVGGDTGGSIRIPAALCGVVGFKPTSGTVDTQMVIPLSSSLDTIGSLAPDVISAARAVAIMAGRDELIPRHASDHRALRIAIPAGWVKGLDQDVSTAWDGVARDFETIDFPDRNRMQKTCLDILYWEAAAFHRRWVDENPELYSPDILARLRTAAEVSGASYRSALAERERLQNEVEECMTGIDALLLPATATTASVIAEGIDVEPLVRFTRPFNVTGQPVFSLPAPAAGLPVGVQVIGHRSRDAELVGIAWSLEFAWKSSAPARD